MCVIARLVLNLENASLSSPGLVPVLSVRGDVMRWASYVEVELQRAERMTRKDHKHRWITMDGHIHESPVPFRDAISVYWMPIPGCLGMSYKHALPISPAVGAL